MKEMINPIYFSSIKCVNVWPLLQDKHPPHKHTQIYEKKATLTSIIPTRVMDDRNFRSYWFWLDVSATSRHIFLFSARISFIFMTYFDSSYEERIEDVWKNSKRVDKWWHDLALQSIWASESIFWLGWNDKRLLLNRFHSIFFLSPCLFVSSPASEQIESNLNVVCSTLYSVSPSLSNCGYSFILQPKKRFRRCFLIIMFTLAVPK